MNVGSLQLALPTAVLAIACSGLVYAADTVAPTVPPRELQAKIQYCTYCHQPTGQGYRGSSPIPRLAGQQTEYFENQVAGDLPHQHILLGIEHVLDVAAAQSEAEIEPYGLLDDDARIAVAAV